MFGRSDVVFISLTKTHSPSSMLSDATLEIITAALVVEHIVE
jgi:hypothetical protein